MGRRILLLTEDLLENNRLEGLLKKIGFDITTLASEVGLAEQILGFRPELIVAAGTSPKLSALSVGGKLKEMRAFTGQVILGFPKEAGRLAPQELLKTRVDRILETPFDTELLIRSICELLSLDADSHVDKLNKFTMYAPGPENQAVRNGEAAPPVASVVKITSRLTSAEREARFQKYVSQRSVQTADGGLDRKISDTTFKRSEVRDKWAEVKKDWDPQKLADQDALKKNFARALFEDEGEGDKD